MLLSQYFERHLNGVVFSVNSCLCSLLVNSQSQGHSVHISDLTTSCPTCAFQP